MAIAEPSSADARRNGLKQDEWDAGYRRTPHSRWVQWYVRYQNVTATSTGFAPSEGTGAISPSNSLPSTLTVRSPVRFMAMR